MYFIKKRLLFFLSFGFFSSLAFSQDATTGYWQPNIAVNYKVVNGYSHNFSVSKRSYLYRDSELGFTIKQLDIDHFSTLKTKDNQTIGIGIKYRLRDVFENSSGNELRLTQQYNINFRKNNVRYGNRLRSEQRIRNVSTIHRFRYRFAIDFPLQGEELDIGEAYVVFSTESLLGIGKARAPEFDQRLTTHLGWLINNSTKIQIGAEYRAENYTHNTQNIYFLTTNLVLSL